MTPVICSLCLKQLVAGAASILLCPTSLRLAPLCEEPLLPTLFSPGGVLPALFPPLELFFLVALPLGNVQLGDLP